MTEAIRDRGRSKTSASTRWEIPPRWATKITALRRNLQRLPTLAFEGKGGPDSAPGPAALRVVDIVLTTILHTLAAARLPWLGKRPPQQREVRPGRTATDRPAGENLRRSPSGTGRRSDRVLPGISSRP